MTAFDTPLWLEDVNIHCATYNARYGDLSVSQTVGGLLLANDILTYNILNLNDLYFANDTAGDNTVLVAVGVQIPPERMKVLGLVT